jgi:hypothetical protein
LRNAFEEKKSEKEGSGGRGHKQNGIKEFPKARVTLFAVLKVLLQ